MIFNYVRVSTVDQNTDRQLVGIECDRVYEEKVSGKDKNRPELQAMLLNLREGDLVNVHELSRLARNTKDLLEIVEQILSVGASIKFQKENLFFQSSEKSDPFQNLMLTMLGAIAQFERDLMLERQREGIAIAKAKGRYKGRQTRFSADEMERMKSEFSIAKNKAAVARNWGISRQYLYKLAANG